CNRLVIATAAIAASALASDAAILRDLPTVRDLLWNRPTVPGNHGVYSASIGLDCAAEAVAEIKALGRSIRERPGDQPRLLGRLLTVVGTLAEYVVGDDYGPQLHPAVAAVLDRLDASLDRYWRLSELAELVNLDPAYLCRLFRRHVGLSPMGYLARAR